MESVISRYKPMHHSSVLNTICHPVHSLGMRRAQVAVASSCKSTYSRFESPNLMTAMNSAVNNDACVGWVPPTIACPEFVEP
jgi:hypothetical protein